MARDIGGCRQVVDDGVNGRLVPVGDAGALAAAIADATTSEWATDARATAEAAFDERLVVERVLSSYEPTAG